MRREKINLNFYFDISLPYLKRFYEDFKLVVTLVQLSEMDSAGRVKYQIQNKSSNWRNTILHLFMKNKSVTRTLKRWIKRKLKTGILSTNDLSKTYFKPPMETVKFLLKVYFPCCLKTNEEKRIRVTGTKMSSNFKEQISFIPDGLSR